MHTSQALEEDVGIRSGAPINPVAYAEKLVEYLFGIEVGTSEYDDRDLIEFALGARLFARDLEAPGGKLPRQI